MSPAPELAAPEYPGSSASKQPNLRVMFRAMLSGKRQGGGSRKHDGLVTPENVIEDWNRGAEEANLDADATADLPFLDLQTAASPSAALSSDSILLAALPPDVCAASEETSMVASSVETSAAIPPGQLQSSCFLASPSDQAGIIRLGESTSGGNDLIPLTEKRPWEEQSVPTGEHLGGILGDPVGAGQPDSLQSSSVDRMMYKAPGRDKRKLRKAKVSVLEPDKNFASALLSSWDAGAIDLEAPEGPRTSSPAIFGDTLGAGADGTVPSAWPSPRSHEQVLPTPRGRSSSWGAGQSDRQSRSRRSERSARNLETLLETMVAESARDLIARPRGDTPQLTPPAIVEVPSAHAALISGMHEHAEDDCAPSIFHRHSTCPSSAGEAGNASGHRMPAPHFEHARRQLHTRKRYRGCALVVDKLGVSIRCPNAHLDFPWSSIVDVDVGLPSALSLSKQSLSDCGSSSSSAASSPRIGTPGPVDDASTMTASAMCNACNTRRQPRTDRGPSPRAPPVRDHIVTMRVREPAALGADQLLPLTLELRLPDGATAARVADAAVAFKAYELKAMLCAAMARRNASAYQRASSSGVSTSGSELPRPRTKADKPSTTLLLDELGTAFWWGKSSPFGASSLVQVQTHEKPGSGARPAAMREAGEAPRMHSNQPLKCPSDEPVLDIEDAEDWGAPVAAEQQLQVPDDERSPSSSRPPPEGRLRPAVSKNFETPAEGNEVVYAEGQPIAGEGLRRLSNSAGSDVTVRAGIFGGFRLPSKDLCDIANEAVNGASWDVAFMPSPNPERQPSNESPIPRSRLSHGFDLDEPVGWAVLPTAMPPPVAGGNGPRPWWPLIGGLSEIDQPDGQEALTAPASANNTPRHPAGAAVAACISAGESDHSQAATVLTLKSATSATGDAGP